MASRVVLRRSRFITDYINTRSIQGFHFLKHGYAFRNLDSHDSYSIVDCSFSHDNCIGNADVISVPKEDLNILSGKGELRRGYNGITVFPSQNGRSEFFYPTGMKWMSQSIRNSSTATAKQQEFGNEDEGNAELVTKKRKEASPEECDQAVEGLSTAKAKVKSKKLQEPSKAARTILQRVWATFLGIGPALKAVASMSKLDSLSRMICFYIPLLNIN